MVTAAMWPNASTLRDTVQNDSSGKIITTSPLEATLMRFNSQGKLKSAFLKIFFAPAQFLSFAENDLELARIAFPAPLPPLVC